MWICQLSVPPQRSFIHQHFQGAVKHHESNVTYLEGGQLNNASCNFTCPLQISYTHRSKLYLQLAGDPLIIHSHDFPIPINTPCSPRLQQHRIRIKATQRQSRMIKELVRVRRVSNYPRPISVTRGLQELNCRGKTRSRQLMRRLFSTSFRFRVRTTCWDSLPEFGGEEGEGREAALMQLQ